MGCLLLRWISQLITFMLSAHFYVFFSQWTVWKEGHCRTEDLKSWFASEVSSFQEQNLLIYEGLIKSPIVRNRSRTDGCTSGWRFMTQLDNVLLPLEYARLIAPFSVEGKGEPFEWIKPPWTNVLFLCWSTDIAKKL